MTPSTRTPETTHEFPDRHNLAERWVDEIRKQFDPRQDRIIRIRDNGVLDENAPRHSAQAQLTQWIYTDVHLRCRSDGSVCQMVPTHPWLSQDVLGATYASSGWQVRSLDLDTMEVTRDGLAVRIPRQYGIIIGQYVTALIPRAYPLHLHGWNVILSPFGGPTGRQHRFYLPGPDTTASPEGLLALLDASGLPWRLKFHANAAEERPDRAVLYVSRLHAARMREYLAAHTDLLTGPTRQGPGFAVSKAHDLFEDVPLNRTEIGSYGLTVSTHAARAMLTRRALNAEDLITLLMSHGEGTS